MIVGSLFAFWDANQSDVARRMMRRSVLAATGAQVVATVLMCIYTVLTGAPWWLTVLFTVVGVALMALAVVIGPMVRGLPVPANDGEQGYPRAEFRRDRRRIVITAIVTLIVVAALIGATLLIFRPEESVSLFAFAPLFAVMAAGIACTVVTLRLSRRMRDTVGGDLARVRDIGKVVIRGKAIELSPEDEDIASRFAALSWVVQAYQLVGFACVVAGVILINFRSLMQNGLDLYVLISLVILGATSVVAIPISLIQLRRTRRYASDHRVES